MEQSTKHSRKLKRVVIKEELVALTKDILDAIILGKLIEWTFDMYNFDELLEEKQNSKQNSKSQNDFLEEIKTKGWICKNASYINKELMFNTTKETLRNHIFSLTQEQKDKKGNVTRVPLLEERNNPLDKWDKTLQYRVKIYEINSELIKLGYSGINDVLITDKEEPSQESSPNPNIYVSEPKKYVPNNISIDILSSLHSSSSSSKEEDSSESVIEESRGASAPHHTTDHTSVTNKKLYTAGISLPNEVENSLPEGASIPTHNKGVLKRRLLTKAEMIRTKSIEKRILIDATKKVVKKELPPLKTSSDVREILDFWVEQGFKLQKENTKGIREVAKKVKGLLNGTLYKQTFTIEDIKMSIIRHQMMAFDDKYEPTILSKKQYLQTLRLGEFIENTHSSNGDKSIFLKCHKYEPKLSQKLLPDTYPSLTSALKNIFAKEVCGGQIPKSYSTYDENCFRSAVTKVFKFFSSNSYNLVPRIESELIIPLCDCLKETCSGGSFIITPGFLCSDKTFNYRLPQYLTNQGLMLR